MLLKELMHGLIICNLVYFWIQSALGGSQKYAKAEYIINPR